MLTTGISLFALPLSVEISSSIRFCFYSRVPKRKERRDHILLGEVDNTLTPRQSLPNRALAGFTELTAILFQKRKNEGKQAYGVNAVLDVAFKFTKPPSCAPHAVNWSRRLQRGNGFRRRTFLEHSGGGVRSANAFMLGPQKSRKRKVLRPAKLRVVRFISSQILLVVQYTLMPQNQLK